MKEDEGDMLHTELERLFLFILTRDIKERDHNNIDDDDDDDDEDVIVDEQTESLSTYLASCFEEKLEDCVTNPEELDIDDWKKLVVAWLNDIDENMYDLVQKDTVLLEIISTSLGCIFLDNSNEEEEEEGTKFNIGDHVLAILDQDQDWHEGTIDEILIENNYKIIFNEWGNPQLTKEDNIVIDEEFYKSQQAVCLGCCMCKRDLPLTFHHLIPREVHNQVLKRGDFPNDIEEMYQRHKSSSKKNRNCTKKHFLQIHGIDICRQCHSHIHRLETNKDLGDKYNTFAKVIGHPGIKKWLTWAKKC